MVIAAEIDTHHMNDTFPSRERREKPNLDVNRLLGYGMKQIKTIFLAGILGIGWTFSGHVLAKEDFYDVETINFQVPLNKSRLVQLRQTDHISGGNPKILKIETFHNTNQILFKGESLGTTNVMVWYRGSVVKVINVEVSHDLESLKLKLHELLPGEQIDVRSTQHSIVLSGQVSGLDKMQAAVDIAKTFLPGGAGSASVASKSNTTNKSGTDTAGGKNKPDIINMMQVAGAQQVMLEVKVAEISRQLARMLKIQMNALRPGDVAFGALSGGGSLIPASPLLSTGGSLVGPFTNILRPNTHSIDAAGLFLSALTGDFIFNLTVDAAKDQNLAKILSEPTLTTLSGQEATFLSGGEFPIPVPQAGVSGFGNITIVFKPFGVSLRFIPVVLDSGRINLNLNVRVSELSDVSAITDPAGQTGISFSVPSLTLREASSTLELGDGQTMSIAGLFDEKLRENVNKFPGLGDIPVLGALFRSEQFRKDKTELVIFVTPKLAKAQVGKITLPTDSFVEPDDIDFYLFGNLEHRNASKLVMDELTPPGSNREAGLEGQFGHKLSEE